ncbi:hypothetical protein M8J76_004616 [Diaphorina citri]|nr:hypothetical protein M8J76_004616 [Diaphorina citri]
MKTADFKGMMAPVFTGFTKEYELNVSIVPQYAEYLSRHKVKQVLVNGTTGEGVSMTTAERKLNLEAWMTEAKTHGFTVMVQIGGTCFQEVVELAKHAESLNVHAVLCLPELFFTPASVEDLVDYLRDVGEAAPATPLFYYHIPMFTRVTFDMEVFARKCLEAIPTFRGIKYTHTNLDELQRIQSVDKALLILAGMMYGCSSQIATTINIFPDLIHSIYEDFAAGRYEQAQEEQNKLSKLTRAIAGKGSWVSTMKPAMSKASGLDFGPVRKPLKCLTIEAISAIENLVVTARLS